MSKYIINGPDSDLKRLEILSKTYDDQSVALLRRANIQNDMHVLELGCGSGHLATRIASELLSLNGKIIALDINEERISAAKNKIAPNQTNLEFQLANVLTDPFPQGNDFILARSILCHLDKPAHVIKKMLNSLNDNGTIVIEEPDMTGIINYPPNKFMDEGLQLLTHCVQLQNADLSIGYKIPSMLKKFGVKDIQVSIHQPCFMSGELKCTMHTALQNSAETILKHKLATKAHLMNLIKEMKHFIDNENNLATRPRIFQVFGRKPD